MVYFPTKKAFLISLILSSRSQNITHNRQYFSKKGEKLSSYCNSYEDIRHIKRKKKKAYMLKYSLLKFRFEKRVLCLHVCVPACKRALKYTYSNILKILPPIKENFQIKRNLIFFI